MRCPLRHHPFSGNCVSLAVAPYKPPTQLGSTNSHLIWIAPSWRPPAMRDIRGPSKRLRSRPNMSAFTSTVVSVPLGLHRCSTTTKETQVTDSTQLLFGRTLRHHPFSGNCVSLAVAPYKPPTQLGSTNSHLIWIAPSWRPPAMRDIRGPSKRLRSRPNMSAFTSTPRPGRRSDKGGSNKTR